ncbi:THO complex subunit 5 homolog [Xenia sp. Carnegie-2017]|uniref:THO complex subunit 5 homolog n=1 Tax=Xenia sp. Carnegie-2017 TaxID=2897299 RepID=UPI001F047A1E|nr:THO complex subunit 5 homolog [Xenia sp. Carnegie-2017]
MRSKRSRTSSDTSSSTTPPVKKLSKTNVTLDEDSKSTVVMVSSSASSISSEASETKSEPFTGVERFRKACQKIKSLFEQMKAYKDNDKNGTELENLRMQCLLSFVTLKNCNRSAQFLNRQARDDTLEAKQKVDGLHLELQNLLYEITHLKKEINKCLQFKSKDQEIDLISEEELKQELEKMKDEKLSEDPHKLMLARLDWELKERKSLTAIKQSYVTKKKTMAHEIQEKNDFLNSLEPQLKTILQATSPIQDFLGMQLESKRIKYQTAKFLPRPLYVLFVQSMAYQEACDPNLNTEIIGDVEAAKAQLEDKAGIPGVVDVELDENVDKTEEDEVEVDELPKKRQHRRTTEELCQEEKVKTALKQHPLQVQLEITCKGDIKSKILFCYIPLLNIITVSLDILCSENEKLKFSGRSLLSPDSVLTCLFPEDFGDVTPNPTNHHQLNKLGIENVTFGKLNIGRPYKWVQKLCGLEFPTSDSKSNEIPTVNSSLSASHMERTVKSIKSRILTRILLTKQLISLESLSIPLSEEGRHLFPVKSLSTLESWNVITTSEYSELPFVENKTLIESITENDMLFLATFSCENVKLKAAVIVPSDYPVRTPLFKMAVSSNGSYVNNDYVRAIETEVNVFYEEMCKEDSRDNILSNQLRRVQMCFDVFNDTNASEKHDMQNHEFLIMRVKRGRDRGMALEYDQKHACFVHRCK